MLQSTPRPAGSDSGPPVYFDANPLGDRHLTGIGRYAARLALAMRPLREVRFFAGDRELVPPASLSWDPNQDLGSWARHMRGGARRLLGDPPAGSVGIYPLLRPIARRFDREVSILHDLTPLLLPHTHKATTRSHFQGFCAAAIPSSDVAVAVSESTRADAEWLTAIDPARIVVAPSGPSLCVSRHADRKATRRSANLGLVVSTLEPRKNPEAFCDWFHTSTALPDDAQLCWVGSIGWITSRRDLKRLARRAGSRRRINFLGVVSDAQLCRLYRTAAYTAYPSLYEGFGFPVLDSLRHGTPVIAAMNSSLREFRADAVCFFDPDDPATLDAAYARCRDHAVGRPVDIAPLEAAYSWDNVAGTILAACTAGVDRRDAAVAAA